MKEREHPIVGLIASRHFKLGHCEPAGRTVVTSVLKFLQKQHRIHKNKSFQTTLSWWTSRWHYSAVVTCLPKDKEVCSSSLCYGILLRRWALHLHLAPVAIIMLLKPEGAKCKNNKQHQTLEWQANRALPMAVCASMLNLAQKVADWVVIKNTLKISFGHFTTYFIISRQKSYKGNYLLCHITLNNTYC